MTSEDRDEWPKGAAILSNEPELESIHVADVAEVSNVLTDVPQPIASSPTDLKQGLNLLTQIPEEYSEKYRKDREIYEKLTTDVRSQIEELLKLHNEKDTWNMILHQEPSSRTKKISSVKEKVSEMVPQAGPKGTRAELLEKIRDKMRDLAGVRVLVYFPDDVSRVVELIEKSPKLEIYDSAVSYSRNRSDHRKEDQVEYAGGGDVKYSDGAWAEKSMSTKTIMYRWRNSGYRAVHLYVGLVEEKIATTNSDGQLKRMNTKDGTPNDHHSKPDSGPDIIDCEVDLGANKSNIQSDSGPDSSLTEFELQDEKVAQIQIMTVVMHAWSQLEHDVIYKNPNRLVINDTMARMLDAINGLSLNSEIVLQELRLNLNAAMQQARIKEHAKWESEGHLDSFLREEYGKHDGKQKPDQRWISALYMVASSALNPGPEIMNPEKLRKFILDNKILNHSLGMLNDQDIAVRVLLKLGDKFGKEHTEANRFGLKRFDRSTRTKGGEKLGEFLYTCRLVADAFSIMVAIDRADAIDFFKIQFPNDIETMRKINSIALDISIPNESKPVEEIQDFSCRFLQTSKYPTHNLAIALSTLRFYTILGSSQEVTNTVSYTDLKDHHGNFQLVAYLKFRRLRDTDGISLYTEGDKSTSFFAQPVCYTSLAPNYRRRGEFHGYKAFVPCESGGYRKSFGVGLARFDKSQTVERLIEMRDTWDRSWNG